MMIPRIDLVEEIFSSMMSMIFIVIAIVIVRYWRKTNRRDDFDKNDIYDSKKKKYKLLILIISPILLYLFSPFILMSIDRENFRVLEKICNGYNKNKPTEFFKIKEVSIISPNDNTYYAYFAISNAPNDTLLLKKIVEEYNFKTIPVDTLKKYYVYERRFFLSTKQAWWRIYPCSAYRCCDYPHEDDELEQQVCYHRLIMATYYTDFSHSLGRWDYCYHFKDYEYKNIKIADIDSFYDVRIHKTGK